MWYFVNSLPLVLDIPVIPYVSQAIVTPTDIAATTKAAMVSIDSLNSICSSGIIIHRRNNIYTVLVQQDFLEDGSDDRFYGVTTSDGLKHPFLPGSRRLESQTNELGNGLGIVKFRSSVSYQTAKISSKPAAISNVLYIAGSVCPSSEVITRQTFVLRSGKLTSLNEEKGIIKHNGDVIRGMEGAALLNKEGEIIGVQGGQKRYENDYADPRLLGVGISSSRILGFTNSLEIKTGESIATSNDRVPNFDELFLSAYMKSNLSWSDNLSALADINKAIENRPGNWEAYKLRGSIRLRLQDIPGSLFDYSKALEINPKDIDAYIKRAELKNEKIRDYLGAVSDYDRIIELNPNDSDSYYSRAEIKRKHLDDLSGARQDYDRVISILSNDFSQKYNRYEISDAYEQRAFINTQLNNIDKALSDYSILISSSSYFKYVDSFNRGDLLYSIGREKQSLEDFKAIINALKISLKNRGTKVNLNFMKACTGIVEIKEGDKRLALKEISTALIVLKEREEYSRVNRIVTLGDVSLDLSMIASIYKYKGIANRLNGNRIQMINDWKEARSLYKDYKNVFGYNLMQRMLKDVGA